MKQPSEVARSARAASRPSVGLPAKDMAQVRAIAATANVRKSSKHKALLFNGANATAAAEAMAKRLRRDLYRVDLHAVVSKYIGETEKNLGRVFAEAEANDAILFFDEADALFGKRSNVKDTHDRYSNLLVDYLLRRIEGYAGLVVFLSKPRTTLSMTLRRRLLIYDFPPAARKLG
jgi:SpoVK/Ycf46/Vps4 family AAA+-type ATPase